MLVPLDSASAAAAAASAAALESSTSLASALPLMLQSAIMQPAIGSVTGSALATFSAASQTPIQVLSASLQSAQASSAGGIAQLELSLLLQLGVATNLSDDSTATSRRRLLSAAAMPQHPPTIGLAAGPMPHSVDLPARQVPRPPHRHLLAAAGNSSITFQAATLAQALGAAASISVSANSSSATVISASQSTPTIDNSTLVLSALLANLTCLSQAAADQATRLASLVLGSPTPLIESVANISQWWGALYSDVLSDQDVSLLHAAPKCKHVHDSSRHCVNRLGLAHIGSHLLTCLAPIQSLQPQEAHCLCLEAKEPGDIWPRGLTYCCCQQMLCKAAVLYLQEDVVQLTSISNSFAASLDTSLATVQNNSSSTTLSAAAILTAAGAGCDRTGGQLKARFAANVNLTAELPASDTANASTSRRLLSTSCSATAVSVVSGLLTAAGLPLVACRGTSWAVPCCLLGHTTACTSVAGCMSQQLPPFPQWLAQWHSSQRAPSGQFGSRLYA